MENVQIKLMDILSRTLELGNCDNEDRNLIISVVDFLKVEQHFFETYDIEELKVLGKKLNDTKFELNKKLNEVKVLKNFELKKNGIFKDKFYLLGIRFILKYEIYSPEIRQYVSQIRGDYYSYVDDIKKFFEILYDEYSITQDVYNQNSIDGIARFMVLNNKIVKKCGKSIAMLINEERIIRDLILNLTSSESILAAYTSTIQADKVLSGSVGLNSFNKKKIICL